MPDLEFTSKGAAKVISDQEKIRKSAEGVSKEYKEQNRAIQQLGRDASKSFDQTRTQLEKLHLQAAKLERVINGTEFDPDQKGKARDALQRINKEIAAAEKNSGQAGGALEKAFGGNKARMLVSLGTAIGGIGVSAAAVFKVIRDELAATQDRVDATVKRQISVGASRNVVIRNLPGASDALQRNVLLQNQRLVGSTGVSEVDINLARAEALSASGGDVSGSRAAVDIAAQFLPDQPGQIGAFAGSLLDLSKVTGTRNARVNLGLLTSVGGLSRVVDPSAQAQNIPSALIGAKSFGTSTQTGAALFGALSEGSADITGATSGTGLVALAQQLQELGDEQFAGKKFIPELAGTGSTLERIRLLQGNRDVARRFVANASFEKKVLGPITDLLLNRRSDTAKAFESKLSAIPDNAGLSRQADQVLASFRRNNTLEPVAARGRYLETALEQMQVTSGRPDYSREELENLRAILQESGSSATASRFSVMLNGLRDGRSTVSAREVEGILQRRIADLRDGTTTTNYIGGGTVGADSFAVPTTQPATDAEKRQADLLQGILDQLRTNNDELKRNTTATKESGGLSVNDQ